MEKVLTLPLSPTAPLSIRAKALVFHDPGSLDLLAHVERIARSDATVLVTGETGTGKELIARHIHNTSGRSGPFVAVNCGAFSESLIDAELFGHEAGAFTGALGARAGWFEAANGGTLFLDEIGDLPLNLQVKLLRVLQERQVVRLGSRRAVPLDVRLVAATNIDLRRAVEAQHFRADLFYRLSVASVRLPPLRERRADILPLVRHFIHIYSARQDRPDAQLSQAAQTALLDYGWPGNIRELENVVHFALIVAHDDLVTAEDLRLLPLAAQQAQDGQSNASSSGQRQGTTGSMSLHESSQEIAAPAAVLGSWRQAQNPAVQRLVQAWRELLDQGHAEVYDLVEQALVHAAFEHGQQNQVRTAKTLGITRNSLRTLLKRHGLLLDKEERVAFDAPAHVPPLATLHAQSSQLCVGL